MIVIILAGGDGKRMESILPKVLHNVNEIPMIVSVIKTAIILKPEKIFIIVGKYYEIIKNTIALYIDYPIQYCHQLISNGTGGALLCCINDIKDYDECIILSGDVPLISIDTLEKFKFDTCLLITQLDNPFGNGRIKFNEYNEIIDICEEKDCNSNEKLIKYVNCGIYKFQIKNIINLIPFITNNNNNNEYYLTDLIKLHFKNNININIIELFNKIEIMNINTKDDLIKINNLIKEKSA